MGSFLQFWRQPQRVWLRKALFQVHLWTGIGAGLYVLVISISGSLRASFRRAMGQRPRGKAPPSDTAPASGNESCSASLKAIVPPEP